MSTDGTPHKDVFLKPGEFHFGDAHTRVRTLLGSCVAITLWHPRRRVGGMCHFLLPSRIRPNGAERDSRYANEAVECFLHELERLNTPASEYQAKLFGGGSMFPTLQRSGGGDDGLAVPERNILAAESLMRTHGFNVCARDLGGQGHRTIIFDIWSGDVWCRHRPLLQDPADLPSCP
ncbi:chemotaxis protein CheD [Niveibacterium sp. 24ML]|uniref:chemotaxis protein CheD n=1 Tax=Niveibacterium sp. 24ML TaxID=2985512 RepID=UPI00226D8340|nr:chemotaxis protein CheD [Niveibacterium sp. 24ML]MCX9154735.1 chemotaxis protein CheD [Niveibacterium sp. 24ML]